MQDALTVMYTNNVLDDIDFLLLYQASNKKNPALPYWKYDRFDMTRLTHRVQSRILLWHPRIAAVSISVEDTRVICV